MSVNVTIITTANRVRKFVQQDLQAIEQLLTTLQRSAQLFANRTLIIGSEHATEIFSPSSITRIEIETDQDLAAFLPSTGDSTLTRLDADTVAPPSETNETHMAGRIDFFFEGGDALAAWYSAPRPTMVNERLMRLTRLFEQPVIIYTLPAGGIGLMNPGCMTRAQIGNGAETLPAGAWRLEPVHD
ncbi:MAG: hypothetical protein IPN53_14975 [Comamonadaceae bacterium]|nr:hypothetical protein [Comamonadaceae bacterium]